MKKYIDYTVEDFVKDEYFIQWILGSDPAVHSFWISWLAENPQKAEVVDKARQLLLLINFKKYQPANKDYLRIWQAIDQDVERIEEKNSDTKIIAMHNRKSATHDSESLFFKSRKIAASFLVGVLLLSVIAWFFLRNPHVNYSTDYGEIKTIVLPDNSTVKLNANSSLSFIDDWKGDNPREVWLDGEAFFSVTHKANHQKFLVHVDELRVEVLGTEFNVNNRKEKAKVVLNSGKIKLGFEGKEDANETGKTICMEPGEMVEVSHQSKAFIKKRVNPELLTSWRNNQLIFEDTPIKEVISAIEDQFGMEIILQDVSLADHRYTGVIPLDNLEVFFTTLSKSFNVNIMKNKQQIIIQKQ